MSKGCGASSGQNPYDFVIKCRENTRIGPPSFVQYGVGFVRNPRGFVHNRGFCPRGGRLHDAETVSTTV